MNRWLKSITLIGKQIAEQTIPGVHAIEDAVTVLKTDATGAEKLAAVEKAVLGGVSAVEFGADKDLLNDAEVQTAYRGFVSSYVAFQNALTHAKAARGAKP